MGRKLIDLSRLEFGRLTVIKRVANTGYGKSHPNGVPTWECRCDCGNVVNVMGGHLRRGDTKSCGCLQREIVLDRIGKDNPNWKGGKHINSAGYILILKPDHPFADKNSNVLEHRLVMENMIGRYLRPEEVVHHANNIRDDNSEDNLVRFSGVGAHTIYHQRLEKIAEHT